MKSSNTPTDLIFRLNRILLSSGRLAPEILGEVANALTVSLGARQVKVGVRTALERRSYFHSTPLLKSAAGTPPRFVFSRALQVQGLEYGHFEVDFDVPPLSPPELMLSLETIAVMLTGYVERLTLEELRDARQAELASLADELANEKALTRAAGIVAERQAIAPATAVQWIRAEADRTRRSLRRIADAIIVGQSRERRTEAA